MNHTVDIGGNLTSMLERLAQQIGTTADKVFPWYVQQSQIEGTITLAILVIALTMSLCVAAYGLMRGKWDYGNAQNFAAVMSIVGCACVVLSTVFTLVELPRAVTQVFNPQYHAMKMLTRDIGKLTGK